jgi:hypothetical protein
MKYALLLAVALVACGAKPVSVKEPLPNQLVGNTANGTNGSTGTSSSSGSIGSTGGISSSSASSSSSSSSSSSGTTGGAVDAGNDAGSIEVDAGPPDAGPPCHIGSSDYTDGGMNPFNACQFCDPNESRSSWSNLPSGTACGNNTAVCVAGTCQSGCFIQGIYYAAGQTHGSCEVCDPNHSITAWTAFADDTVCGSGGFCRGGQCEQGCVIDGGFYQPGGTDNACRSCAPAQNPTGWSNPLTGASIDGGNCLGTSSTCDHGTCIPQCSTDTNCPFNYYCQKPAGVCTYGCSSDAQCQSQMGGPEYWCAPTGDGGALCKVGCIVGSSCGAYCCGAGRSCNPTTRYCN